MKVTIPYHVIKSYRDGNILNSTVIGRYDQQELKEKFGKILENKKLAKSIDFTIDFFTESAIEKITSEINADTIKEEN